MLSVVYRMLTNKQGPVTCFTWRFLIRLYHALILIKTLKVMSLASLPVAYFQAALALLTHCLSSSIARRNCFLVRGVHDGLPATSSKGLQSLYALFLVPFYPCVHRHKIHLCLSTGYRR